MSSRERLLKLAAMGLCAASAIAGMAVLSVGLDRGADDLAVIGTFITLAGAGLFGYLHTDTSEGIVSVFRISPGRQAHRAARARIALDTFIFLSGLLLLGAGLGVDSQAFMLVGIALVISAAVRQDNTNRKLRRAR